MILVVSLPSQYSMKTITLTNADIRLNIAVIDSLYLPRFGVGILGAVDVDDGGADVVGGGKSLDGGTSSTLPSSLHGAEGAGLVCGVSLSGMFGRLPPSCASLPFTQQARQKNLPRRPMWQANSLCIGLSPSKAKTLGKTSMSSLCTQSQAQMPSF